MKEKNKKIKKNKHHKLIILIPMIIVLGVMFAFLIGYLIGTNNQHNLNNNYQSNQTNETNNPNNDKPDTDKTTNIKDGNDIELAREIYFLKDQTGKKIISNILDNSMEYLGKYTCQNLGCGRFQYIPSPSDEHVFLDNNLVLLSEWNGEHDQTIVYNYQTNKVINTYDEAHCSYEFNNGSFSILIEKNNKMGILSSTGQLIYDITLDIWDYFADAQVCNKINLYTEDYTSTGYNGINGVFTKHNKYGVINLQTGETVVDFKYEGLRLMYDDNYSIKESNKWYLVNNKLEKIIPTGYDAIYSFDDVILVGTNISKDITQYKLIDHKGHDLTNTIDIDFTLTDQYSKVTSGIIEFGSHGGGTFTYDLSQKTLSYKQW